MYIRNPETKTRKEIKESLALEQAMASADNDFPKKLTVQRSEDTQKEKAPKQDLNIDDIPCW